MISLCLGLTGLISGCSTLTSTSVEPASPIGNTTSNVELMDDEKTPDSLAPFLEKVSKDHQIPLGSLQKAFEGTKTIPSIKKLVMPPPPGFQKNWKVYRSRFVEPRRLAAGQKFWKEHRAFIEKTARETGVPAEIIVSIIGVETIYGRHMGNFSVKDTLTTLGFDYPQTPNKAARETLFKNQLEDLILLCWSEDKKERAFQNCLNQKGSYAGAIGLPQFMPGSIRRFATDGNRDGKIDLRNSPEDAIASVGQFLKMHGWVKDEPVYLEIQDNSKALSVAQSLADGEPKAKLQLGQLINQGLLKDTDLPSNTPSLIVDLPSPNASGGTDVQYVIGLRNFLAICDYNRSFFYAQSVAEFAEALSGDQPATLAKKSASKNKAQSKQPAKKKNNADSKSSKTATKKTANAN
jgi:membrane-bound lytic murein transglycosylase B